MLNLTSFISLNFYSRDNLTLNHLYLSFSTYPQFQFSSDQFQVNLFHDSTSRAFLEPLGQEKTRTKEEATK